MARMSSQRPKHPFRSTTESSLAPRREMCYYDGGGDPAGGRGLAQVWRVAATTQTTTLNDLRRTSHPGTGRRFV
jgi:hypothetical protein